MSYDVDLVRNGSIVEVEHHEAEGGTYVLGGTTEASLNITYNYYSAYKIADTDYPGLAEKLDGKRAEETMPWLEAMVEKLGTERYRDYWASTPGNAGYALSILLRWAKQHPDATWEVR